MPGSAIPLAALSPSYRPKRPHDHRGPGRRLVWGAGLLFAFFFYVIVNGLWSWKHEISSSGGRYFMNRVEIPVPAFQQDDPRWTFELLGPTFNTIGEQGCALTSAAMVLSYYGIDTDPDRLNQFLTIHDGYTPNGWIYWEKAADLAPDRVEKAYEDLPSYALIDQNLLAGNPVIIRLTLRNGTSHFVVIVGKEGWDYLIRDPARTPDWGVYPLKELTRTIEALRFYRVLSPAPHGGATAALTP